MNASQYLQFIEETYGVTDFIARTPSAPTVHAHGGVPSAPAENENATMESPAQEKPALSRTALDHAALEHDDATVHYNPQSRLHFVLRSNESSFTCEEKTLFEKMVLAMGRKLDEVALVFSPSGPPPNLGPSDRLIVAFEVDSELASMGTWARLKNLQVFTTYAPSSLLKNANFKKPAWDHLKIVMAEYAKATSRH